MRRFLALVALVSCVPPDEGLQYGSVEFKLGASRNTTGGIETDDGPPYRLTFERVLLSFRSMTIARTMDSDDACSFRGRGEVADAVFDPRFGLVQTFNGVKTIDCPNVGVALKPPGANTELGLGARVGDLVELATGDPAHAIVDAVAERRAEQLRIRLRFETRSTSSSFGGCTALRRGVQIVAGERQSIDVRFEAENLFRSVLLSPSPFRIAPFARADAAGDGDGIVTMGELDNIPLSTVFGTVADAYTLPDGRRTGSFGTFVRELFKLTIMYRDVGRCFGNAPGVE